MANLSDNKVYVPIVSDIQTDNNILAVVYLLVSRFQSGLIYCTVKGLML